MKLTTRSRFWAVAPGLSVAVSAGARQSQPATPEYKNPRLPVERRVADLLSRMTLEEKVAQLVCLWAERPQAAPQTDFSVDRGDLSPERAAVVMKHGVGQIARQHERKGPRESAAFANAVQRWLVENTRLGIPAIFHDEALHGQMAPKGTHFPQPLALASSWDPELAARVFTAAALEVRARGGHQVLGPNLDLGREPRWGRTDETYGEDPFLVSRMGVAVVKALQGPGPGVDSEHVIATAKHYAAHGQPEGGTNIAPVNVSERILRENFLVPFHAAVTEAGVMSVMASYNEIDGVPSHASHWLLQRVLREEWGFDEARRVGLLRHPADGEPPQGSGGQGGGGADGARGGRGHRAAGPGRLHDDPATRARGAGLDGDGGPGGREEPAGEVPARALREPIRGPRPGRAGDGLRSAPRARGRGGASLDHVAQEPGQPAAARSDEARVDRGHWSQREPRAPGRLQRRSAAWHQRAPGDHRQGRRLDQGQVRRGREDHEGGRQLVGGHVDAERPGRGHATDRGSGERSEDVGRRAARDRRQRGHQQGGVGGQPSRRPGQRRALRPAGGPGTGDRGDGQARGGDADQRRAAGDPVRRGEGPGDPRGVLSRAGDGRRGCRRALRRLQPVGQASDQLPALDGPAADLLQPQADGEARVPVREQGGALPVRARALVHDIRVFGAGARAGEDRRCRTDDRERNRDEHGSGPG